MSGDRKLFSLVIPIFKNEANLDRLLSEVVKLNARLENRLEVVFVVDGSPDRCYEVLEGRLPKLPLRSQLVLLSRNFGAFSAVRAGLEVARGEFCAVLAADLQEPPELAYIFFKILSEDRADIVFGTRENRSDPFLSEVASNAFWGLYRRFIIKDMPRGGVDVFGCNRIIRDRLLQFPESNTNLIALLFWLGHRRVYVPYERRARVEGKSAWSLGKRIRYSIDSIFNFTDIPIQLLLYCGSISLILACLGTVLVLLSRILGLVQVPGYTPIVIAILFFGAITSLGLGIVGQYLWLTLQNTRNRPHYVLAHVHQFDSPQQFDSAERLPDVESFSASSGRV